METIEKKISKLPSELQREVFDFIDFLIEKKSSKKRKKPTLKWMGGLKEFNQEYSALNLQKKSLDWRD